MYKFAKKRVGNRICVDLAAGIAQESPGEERCCEGDVRQDASSSPPLIPLLSYRILFMVCLLSPSFFMEKSHIVFSSSYSSKDFKIIQLEKDVEEAIENGET